MITVNDVYDLLDQKYDFSSCLAYDNVGLLTGSLSHKVTGVVVCLDVTDEAITQATQMGANLIVSHHPVIFDGLKSVTDETLIYRLVRNDISVISAHTNLDQAEGGVNDILAQKAGLANVEKVADSEGFLYRMGELEEALSSEQLAQKISEALGVSVRFVGQNSFIKRVAVCSGSGGSMLYEVTGQGADAYITADIKHNVFLDAHKLGITLIDATHFATEDIVVSELAKTIKDAFPEINVEENHFSPIEELHFEK